MTLIARSIVIDMLVAVQGEAFRAWYENDPMGEKAVDRAVMVFERQQPQGAVSAGRVLADYIAWINREHNTPLAHSAEDIRAALDTFRGQSERRDTARLQGLLSQARAYVADHVGAHEDDQVAAQLWADIDDVLSEAGGQPGA